MTNQTADPLTYHAAPRPGKVSIAVTKPCRTAQDLALAYTPGVAQVSLAVSRDPGSAYRFTNKGNLIAIVSNGTSVLGLGDIGPLAAKPVMEGKALLFKILGDVDAFDIEIDCREPRKLVEIIASLAPSFGGINLEDIKAPDCFLIEQELDRVLPIPVFHDDQHGAAIVVAAALLNALQLVHKKPGGIRLVINGAGASALASARLLVHLGLSKTQITMCDSRGVVYRGRGAGMNPYKEEFAIEGAVRSLGQALCGADVFIGLSRGNVLSADMLRSMAPNPIVFALANPEPEIEYSVARQARTDLIMATGRSDYPNQVNNALIFPYIFRGALDAKAPRITNEMKLAAIHALADLAKQPVPSSLSAVYGASGDLFGRDHFIPKMLDPRLRGAVAAAVYEAARSSAACPMTTDAALLPNRQTK